MSLDGGKKLEYPGGNPHKHRENMQTLHREAPESNPYMEFIFRPEHLSDIRCSTRAALLLNVYPDHEYMISALCYEHYVLPLCMCVCVSVCTRVTHFTVTCSRRVNTSPLSKCPCHLIILLVTGSCMRVCSLAAQRLWGDRYHTLFDWQQLRC